MKKSLLVLSLFFFSFPHTAFAKALPKGSKYDSRMKSISYNENDITVVKVALGRVNSLIFDDSEEIQKAITGFGDGWDIQFTKNILFLKAEFPSEDERTFSEENLLKKKFWNTNLMVKTNKNFYVFDLEALPEKALHQSAFVIKFRYPKENEKIKRKAQVLLAQKQEKKAVKNLLAQPKSWKNWNYRAKLAKGSERIAPTFVYDDGTNTYMGFTKEKSIPSVFIYDDKKEIIVNTFMKSHSSKYYLLVVNQVHPVIVLRSGSKVVGIFNKGRHPRKYQTTSSPEVERVINE